MGRMILVSNRLPVGVAEREGKRELVRSAGGLVAGLGPVHDRRDSLWIGTGKDLPEDQLGEQRLVVVDIPAEEAERHYEGYSNQVIWPLFHYLLDHVGFREADFDAYRSVNERFADSIAAHATADDTIWVHDYHLMLLPALLRERIPGATIGFFLHIPFPSSEVFRILPHKEEILRGLLGADLVGLHTYDYARHLVSSFRRVVGVEFDEDWVQARDGSCRVGVFPLGVDANSLEDRARSEVVGQLVQKLRERMLHRKVILGVDRLDYTKGLRQKLAAFRRLLEKHERWRQEAVLVQLAVPTRSGIGTYQALKEEIERMVGEINGAFGADGFVPIDYMYRSVPADDLSALYRAADVGWVTPIRDGMNLVAKEYVAHRLDNSGVLVLSEFAGAAAEMGEALLHNPWDADGTADVLDRALRMEASETQQRMAALRNRVHANDVGRWVTRFLSSLEAQSADTRAHAVPAVGSGWLEELSEAFREADRAILALDYDGTLRSLMRTPEQARPTEDLIELLGRLAALEGVDVLVISGRDAKTLDGWLGDLAIHLVAEHGLYCRLVGKPAWDNLLPDADTSWKDSVREILADYASRCPGAFIEEKSASLAWHYRQVDPSFGSWQARELVQHLSEAFANVPVEVLHGAKVVEVRPQGFDKGRAYDLVRKGLGPFDFELAAGDDRTDEDLFQMLAERGWTIKIGRGETRARYRLLTPADNLEMLARLVVARDERS